MKKTYTTPATRAVKIDSEDIMTMMNMSVNDGSAPEIDGESKGDTPVGDDDSFWGAW